MARTKKWYYWTITTEQFRQAPGSVMDMLRYDNAMVSSNPPVNTYLLRSERPPTVARWQSFGITIDNITTRTY